MMKNTQYARYAKLFLAKLIKLFSNIFLQLFRTLRDLQKACNGFFISALDLEISTFENFRFRDFRIFLNKFIKGKCHDLLHFSNAKLRKIMIFIKKINFSLFKLTKL